MELAALAIETLIGLVAEFAKDEVQYARRFKSTFENMKDKIELALALLKDKASAEKKKEALKIALTQLKGVVYKADDVLIDCLIRDEYLNNVSCSGCLLRYDPFFLIQTGKRLKEINDEIQDKIETLRKEGLKETGCSSKNEDDEGSSQVSIIKSQTFNPNVVVGLEEDLKKIKGWIFDHEKELLCIAIVGMGGLGKTTIAQKIFHDQNVFSRFRKVVWIAVSQKFDEVKIFRCLLEKLNIGISTDQIDSSSLMDELKKTLAIVRTCLIVMDNVWEMDNVTWLSDLGSLLSTTTERSCIIITTRKQHLPSTMKADNLRTHTHQPLDAKNSWSLFTEFAFSGSSECSEIDFEKVGRDIVKKCGGLPLAIKVIGSLLKSKGKNLGAWKNAKTLFLDQFSTKENEVMDSLRLSYNDLPPHLKQCLLCLSIYPEGPEIRVEQLIHWWIAEDFVKETRSKTAMEWGYQYVLELINRSLVEVTKHRHYDGRVDSCKLHDMVRELIMKIAEEEGFCSFEGNGTSYWFGLTGEHDTKSLSKNLKLRALFLFTPRCQVDFNRNVISLLSLRVLDFSGTISNFDVKQVKNLLDWIGSLKRLACLNLSEAKVLLELPSSICELFNLQFLVLRDCTNLDKIHTSITNLKKLIVLDLKSCRLRHFPRGLGCLSNLQELSGFKVLIGQAENKGRGLCELKSLTHLRVLSIVISTTVNDAKLSKHELGILSTLNKLEVLAIDADKRQEKHIFDIVERCLIPPQSLLELYLRNFYFETMPHWSGPEKLSSLQYLCIEDAEIKSLIPDQVKNRTPESPWNVNLCLKSLFQLEEDWEELQKIMRVQSLEVNKCDEEKLKNFPCSVNEPGYWPDKETRLKGRAT